MVVLPSKKVYSVEILIDGRPSYGDNLNQRYTLSQATTRKFKRYKVTSVLHNLHKTQRRTSQQP